MFWEHFWFRRSGLGQGVLAILRHECGSGFEAWISTFCVTSDHLLKLSVSQPSLCSRGTGILSFSKVFTHCDKPGRRECVLDTKCKEAFALSMCTQWAFLRFGTQGPSLASPWSWSCLQRLTERRALPSACQQ